MSAPNTLGAVPFPMCKCNVVLKCQRDQPRQESQSSEKTTGYEQLYLILFFVGNFCRVSRETGSQLSVCSSLAVLSRK